jgi:hypothetical protein
VEREHQDTSCELRVKQEVEEWELPSPGSSKRRRLSQKTAGGASASSFESLLPKWAGKCLAFQASGKTWLPTRPCCPANAFLGLPQAPWQVEVGTARKACIQRLSTDQLAQLRGFFQKNSQHALFTDLADLPGATPPSTRASKADESGSAHRGAECMKMWPWMRDLPTRLWAGRGWMLDEEGLHKLAAPEGASAMEGLEVWESSGSAAQEGATSAPERKAAPAPPASDRPQGAQPGQVLTRAFRGLERQSGIQGISWRKEMMCWRVQYWP